jgi:DNA-binding response OmpR family regulator
MSSDILAGKHIALIEDDDFLAEVILQKLDSIGAKVDRYKNGQEGLHGVLNNPPDLIFLDIMMPVMDGYEVLEVLSEKGMMSKVPVIIVSNSGQTVEIQRVVDYGVKDYLVKADLTPEEVFTKARIVLAAKDQEKDQEKDQGKTDDIKVLVVEDDQLLRNLLSMKLTKNGCAPMYVDDGAKAVELAKSFGPEIILLDLMLPGMDGFEILDELKKDDQLKDVPVMVFSNKGEGEDKERAMSAGAAAYKVKAHTDLDEVITELRTLTGRT